MNEEFLQHQELEIRDNGIITLTNTFNTDALDKQMAEERKEKQTGKNLRKVCSIPEFEFQIDPLLKKYQMYCETGEAVLAKKALRDFLILNPQYRASENRF